MEGSEIDAVRALLSSKPRPVGWVQRRERLDEVGSVWAVADDVNLDSVELDGVPGEWSIAPGGDTTRVLMFLHGGCYCSGSILSHRRMVTEAGRAAGTRTLAVGYRLAPEHPFPAALDDALTVCRCVRNQGVAAARIAIGGDSAGGGLTVALINRLCDAGEEIPGCAWLVSPWTDLTMSGETLATKDAVDPIIHKSYLGELANAYLPAGTDRKNPHVSPLYADLKGLPPTLIRSAETLLADATRFAAAAGAADVPVGDLAAHDSCMAPMERESGTRPPGACQRRIVHPRMPLKEGRSQRLCRHSALGPARPSTYDRSTHFAALVLPTNEGAINRICDQ